jgi:hypothetical protein
VNENEQPTKTHHVTITMGVQASPLMALLEVIAGGICSGNFVDRQNTDVFVRNGT